MKVIKKIWNKFIEFWKWLWKQLKDVRTLIIFIIVFLLLSSEVWVFYLLGIISWGSDFSKWCMGIATICWAFWLGPFTPFIPLCITITLGIKALINKLKGRRKKKDEM